MRRASRYFVFLTFALVLLSVSSVTAAHRETPTYRVTITNLTEQGQPFTPPAIALHRGWLNVFNRGQAASFGVKEIAENGNLTPFVDSLNANPRVTNVVVAAGNPPPLFPGQSISVDIEAGRGARFLSVVAMLICTNDGFSGANSLRLPAWKYETVTHYARAYDAGTEINTEDFADIVPPCPALTGVPSSDPGSGVSNPALAENGVVRFHRNIKGIADLVPSIHGWPEPVMKIEVTRID